MTTGSLKSIVDNGKKIPRQENYLPEYFPTLVSDGSLMKHYRRLRNAISKTKIKSQSLDILRLGLEF